MLILELTIEGKDFVFYFDGSNSSLVPELMKDMNFIAYASPQL